MDSFTESDCNIFFRFLREDIRKLLSLLNFPDIVIFDNRSKLSGEEVLLRGLFEFAQGQTKHSISANVFGREWSIQSRAFNWFIDHVYDNFSHLLTDNLEWWWRTGLMHQSKNKIWGRMQLSCPELKDIDDLLSKK